MVMGPFLLHPYPASEKNRGALKKTATDPSSSWLWRCLPRLFPALIVPSSPPSPLCKTEPTAEPFHLCLSWTDTLVNPNHEPLARSFLSSNHPDKFLRSRHPPCSSLLEHHLCLFLHYSTHRALLWRLTINHPQTITVLSFAPQLDNVVSLPPL